MPISEDAEAKEKGREDKIGKTSPGKEEATSEVWYEMKVEGMTAEWWRKAAGKWNARARDEEVMEQYNTLFV